MADSSPLYLQKDTPMKILRGNRIVHPLDQQATVRR